MNRSSALRQNSSPQKVVRITRSEIEQMVDAYLRDRQYLCSAEYRLGMIDLLCQRIFGSGIIARFKRGTAEADAHWAGMEHGHVLLEEFAHKGGF